MLAQPTKILGLQHCQVRFDFVSALAERYLQLVFIDDIDILTKIEKGEDWRDMRVFAANEGSMNKKQRKCWIR